jgi:hypothetical protein
MATYRAAYYRAPFFTDTVLTRPQHASLPDNILIEEAVAEAYRADIVCKSSIDPDEPRVTEEALRAGLVIGKWTDYTASSQWGRNVGAARDHAYRAQHVARRSALKAASAQESRRYERTRRRRIRARTPSIRFGARL